MGTNQILKKVFLSILLSYLCITVSSQTAPAKYWIKFTDKNNNSYQLSSPEQFLSQRALDRRQRQNIAIEEKDLPVTQMYIDSLESLGLVILNTSKWFNSVTVYSTDTALLDTVTNLSFVAQLDKVMKYKNGDATQSYFYEQSVAAAYVSHNSAKNLLDYGLATAQIAMHRGQILHNNGYMGQGIQIAITDAGFYKVDIFPAFDSLWQNSQILGYKDFVHDGVDFSNQHSHGMNVLSVVGANIPGQMIGTAPKASYWLLRSEDAGTEYSIEEDNWVTAAEFADSVGADVINVSLGYETFDDTSQNHTYSDMDGNTTRVSIGADIAAGKGMIVVVSAGNSGNKPWHYIGTPADADSVLTVGSVDGFKNYSDFSSTGPTADNRIKPDVAAIGSSATFQTSAGTIGTGNGTSFSAPIMTGLVACLWQANPDLSNMDIIEFIRKSSHQYDNPDSLMGYGIPDFAYANLLIQGIQYLDLDNENYIVTYPNPFNNEICVEFYSVDSQSVTIEIYDLLGKLVLGNNYKLNMTSYNRIRITDLNSLAPGSYFAKIITKNKTYQEQIVKQ
ncbi:MAG: S8 family serine peptidase [Bacteroidota bacterium]